MKKMLMVASVASMIQQFNMHNIHILLSMGYEVHVACNFKSSGTISQKKTKELVQELNTLGVICHQIDFDRNVWNVQAVRKAYKQMKGLLEQTEFSFLHCHSPIGGVIGRLAGHKCGVKVMYTAHGFHFFKGAPLLNWILFYPIEKWLSRYTDVLITMNEEDTKRAEVFHARKNAYIPGVGIETGERVASQEEKEMLRMKFGFEKNEKIILSVGELSRRKNHASVLYALAKLQKPEIHYVIAGIGKEKDTLLELAEKLGISKQLELLGYCEDTKELYELADVFVFPSLQEGLPVALMEAMASGLPVVASSIRGNKDLITNGQGGFLYPVKDIDELEKDLGILIEDETLRKKQGKINHENSRKFAFSIVDQKMKELYTEIDA